MPFLFLISDICMPGKTGIMLLQEIADSCLGVKVIFLGGHQEFAYVKEAIAYGALDYILKPIDKEQLAQAVRKAIALIDKERSNAELRRKLLNYEFEKGIAPGDEFSAESIRQTDIHKVKEFVEKNFAQNITLETVAGIACMNPYYFSAFFKKQTGENFKDFLLRVRMEKKDRSNQVKSILSLPIETFDIFPKIKKGIII